jgi:hypothetical protein
LLRERNAADEGVLIERVVVVVADPRASATGRLEPWHARGEQRPGVPFERGVVRREIARVDVGVRPRRDAAQIRGALRSEPEPGRIDHERCVAEPRGRIEHEHRALASRDRQLEPEWLQQPGRARARGTHEPARRELLAVGEHRGRDRRAVAAAERGHACLAVADT